MPQTCNPLTRNSGSKVIAVQSVSKPSIEWKVSTNITGTFFAILINLFLKSILRCSSLWVLRQQDYQQRTGLWPLYLQATESKTGGAKDELSSSAELEGEGSEGEDEEAVGTLGCQKEGYWRLQGIEKGWRKGKATRDRQTPARAKKVLKNPSKASRDLKEPQESLPWGKKPSWGKRQGDSGIVGQNQHIVHFFSSFVNNDKHSGNRTQECCVLRQGWGI